MTTLKPSIDSERKLNILLVEDNPADVRLTQEVFKDYAIRNCLHTASDGEEAIAFLKREGAHAGAPRPDLILLDLNLPRKDGREVLSEIKNHPDLRRIPVVVLTTSKAHEDILKAYDLHANCYIQKPLDLNRFTHVVHETEKFWLDIVNLPPS